MAESKTSVSSSSSEQVRLVHMKLPILREQKINTQVRRTHSRTGYSLLRRESLFIYISQILQPATNFVDSILLDKKVTEKEDELNSLHEFNSALSKFRNLGENCDRLKIIPLSEDMQYEDEDDDEYEDEDELESINFLELNSALFELRDFGNNFRWDRTIKLKGKAIDEAEEIFNEIDIHELSIHVLKFLSYKTWDEKAVKTMGSFVLKFVELLEFLLHHPNQSSSDLALTMVASKKNHVSIVGTTTEQPIDQLNNLIKITLELTQYICDLTLLTDTEYNRDDLILDGVHWIILSAIAGYLQITLILKNRKCALELSQLISNISHILNDFKNQCTICQPQIDEMETHLRHIGDFEDAFGLSKVPTKMSEQMESFQVGCLPCSTIAHVLQLIAFSALGMKKPLSKIPVEMPELMKSFMYSKDGHQSLIDGSTMCKVDLEVLHEKAILFFISDLDISTEKVENLREIYKEIIKEDYYKIVWVPFVLKWNEELRQKFENLKSKMPWYIICYDSPIAGVWYFKGRPFVFRDRPSYVIIDLRLGNQSSCGGTFDYPVIQGSEQFPIRRLYIHGPRIVLLCETTSLSSLYPGQPSADVADQEKIPNVFQGFLARISQKVAQIFRSRKPSQHKDTSRHLPP